MQILLLLSLVVMVDRKIERSMVASGGDEERDAWTLMLLLFQQ